MFGIENFWLFITTTAILTVTPGPTSLYLVSRSIAQGRKAGVYSSLGINSAVLIHIIAAGLGLSAIIVASATAFAILKYAGALFLIALGIIALLDRKNPFDNEPAAPNSWAGWKIYAQGLLTDLLNPKASLFFLAYFPQFIDQTSEAKLLQVAVLGVSYIVIGILWEMTLVLFATRITKTVRDNPIIAVWMKRVMGGVFIGLGLRLATEDVR